MTLLHYLKKRFPDEGDVHLRLIEKEPAVGGTIHSVRQGGNLFESGPNGFLDSKPSTLELIKDLGLNDELIQSGDAAKIRYICIKNELHALPSSLGGLLKFKPLSVLDKMRIPFEAFVPKGGHPEETVYEFGKRRLGENFAKYFLDPMVSGIFAGDAKNLNLQAAFPRMCELESNYGSLIKALFSLKKERKDQGADKDVSVKPGETLCSLRDGMGRLLDAMYQRYQKNIQLGEEAIDIQKVNDGVIVETDKVKYYADKVILCVPSYAAAKALKPLNEFLASELDDISYASLAVVGLVYNKSDFKNPPDGFGYLIPSSEKKEVLGVLFSSNIFESRASADQVLLQVMIGGVHNPQSVQKSREELIEIAKNEVKTVLATHGDTVDHFVKICPKAIPQYNKRYPVICQVIQREMTPYKNLHLLANYLGGISVNDCTFNAQKMAEQVQFENT